MTKSLILHLTEKWKKALEENKVVGVLFIDFKKAFHSICHKTLELKLQAAGINGLLYDLITIYLTNRKQYVEINGQCSTQKAVEFGVPQSSVLGLKLFSIHVNDLPDVPSKGSLEMFADDTEFFYIGDTMDEVTINIQTALDEISTRCKQNSLALHPDKTEVMLLSKKPFIGPARPIKIEDHDVDYVSESKFLGIIVDNKINWESHITKAASNMNSKIKQLKRMKSLPTEVIETIHFKGILPGLTYGMAVWGNCSNTKMEHLERVHRRAAYIIHKISKGIDNTEVLQRANWKAK